VGGDTAAPGPNRSDQRAAPESAAPTADGTEYLAPTPVASPAHTADGNEYLASTHGRGGQAGAGRSMAGTRGGSLTGVAKISRNFGVGSKVGRVHLRIC